MHDDLPRTVHRKRRQLLALAAAAALPLAAGRLYAAPTASAKLLVVFLRGGYDAANLLIPVSSDDYYALRPNIAIGRPESAPGAALPIDADWGLHPALRDTVWPMYERGEAAFIPFCGTHDVTRSHFETQDDVELGQAVGTVRSDRSGFLNRLLRELSGRRPIAFTDQLPLVFRGAAEVPNIALRSLRGTAFDDRQRDLIRRMYAHTALAAQVNEGFELRAEVLRAMTEGTGAAGRGAVTTKGFELEAQRIGRLMADRFDVGFVDVGGWDTHVSQGAGAGYLAGRFAELGRGLVSLADALGDRWRNTVVVVVSEFGRTFRENGNRGTDHGHGTVYWVLGGAVRGGHIAGEQVAVTQATLFQNRDYPVLNEYRAVLAGLLSRLYGLRGGQLDNVFPNAVTRDLALV